MISIPTTFIVGAGASEPFGYPIARVLKGEVIEINDEYLHPHGFTREQFRDFTEHLRHSPISSVDAFIERFPRYEDIGKACIALALALHEDELRLFPRKVAATPSWYELLANAIDDGRAPISDNNLSIITFNYDRSLEYYLTAAVARSREIPTSSAWQALASIPIVHVYGSIGDCPPQLDGAREYAATNASMHRAIQEGLTSIRIVTTARDDDPLFERANDLILQSKRVVFLGFGFDPTNVRRLQAFEERWPDVAAREVWATTSGITGRQMERIARDVLHDNWEIGNRGGSIVGLLTNQVVLDESI